MSRLLAAAMVALCAACGPGAAPSGPPTDSPTPSPPAEPTLASVTASAATPSPAAGGSVVLRMHHTGGHLYPGAALDVAPAFTLYDDGTVIYRPGQLPMFGPGGAGGGLRTATMDVEQVAALVAFALGPGGLSEASELYDDVPVADAFTTNFTIDAGGVNKRVAVYALGDEMGPGPEIAHRQRFDALSDLLGSFEREVARGNAVDTGPFEPAAYRVTIIADEFTEQAPSAEWPWDDLEPADFERDQSGFGVRLLSPAEAAPLFEMPVADVGDPVVIGPDEVNYLIRYRPLLPDEIE